MNISQNEKHPYKNTILQAINFISSGIGGMGAIATVQPVDFCKVNIQLLSEAGNKNIKAKQIVQKALASKGGPLNLYRGLTPALLRQAIFCTLRMGLFYSAIDYAQQTKHRSLSIYEKAPISMVAGGIASWIATPCDIAVIRMQSDNLLPVERRRNYKGITHAFVNIVKEEKFLSLWKGATPTILRAAFLNLALLVPFEEAKERLAKLIPDIKSRTITSSVIASFIATIVCLPFDNVKVKFQRMQKDPKSGKMPYKGIIDCYVKTLQREGFLKLWSGYWAFFWFIFPFGLVSLNLADFVRINSKKMVEKALPE